MGPRISRSIIESHGGRLWAADRSPRRASFYFTLPTKAETPEYSGLSERAISAPQRGRSRHGLDLTITATFLDIVPWTSFRATLILTNEE